MGNSGKDLRTIRSEVNRLEKEIAMLTKELDADSDSSKQLKIRRLLKRKRETCSDKKRLKQVLELDEILRPAKSALGEAAIFRAEYHINLDLRYYAVCFHAYLGDKMDIEWSDLACALDEERSRMPEGGQWEGPYHTQLLGHLEAVGVSKEQWECSLSFAIEDNWDYCALMWEPKRVLNDQLRKDKELLNSEEARQVFLPGQKEMFTRLIEEYEAHKFLWPPPT